MRTRTVILLSTFLLAASGAPAQEPAGETAPPAVTGPVLTHDDVRQFMAAYDSSFASRRPEAVMRFFADRLAVAVRGKPSSGGEVTRFDRAAFEQVWRQILPQVDELEQQRSREIIRVLPGGQRAQHRSLLSQSMRNGAKVISGRSEELVTIELVDGTPKIVTIQAVELEDR
ncbi:MAG TPA: hypothetical protein VGG06_22080 [Thermoanaerobaculia bacterium]